MNIKTRYTISTFLKLFLMVSISFLLLFFFIEIIDNTYSIMRHGGRFSILKPLYRLPSIFVEISPVLTFLSSMFLLGEMIKYGEIRVLVGHTAVGEQPVVLEVGDQIKLTAEIDQGVG
ncbi:MAG: LptF/LptG family permease, partial [Candidatus Omnitrophica bacterium]|nr:LptF/LptG family permease [Candidatus Omnitrophota bacterium]